MGFRGLGFGGVGVSGFIGFGDVGCSLVCVWFVLGRPKPKAFSGKATRIPLATKTYNSYASLFWATQHLGFGFRV